MRSIWTSSCRCPYVPRTSRNRRHWSAGISPALEPGQHLDELVDVVLARKIQARTPQRLRVIDCGHTSPRLLPSVSASASRTRTTSPTDDDTRDAGGRFSRTRSSGDGAGPDPLVRRVDAPQTIAAGVRGIPATRNQRLRELTPAARVPSTTISDTAAFG